MEKEKYIVKECKYHGFTKHIYISSAKRYKCCKCQSEAVQKRRDTIKKILVEYKGGKCEICGYNKCIQALEFHHIDSAQKDFGIGAKGYTRSLEKNKKEADKCILVCANCHREIHEQMHKDKINEKLSDVENCPIYKTLNRKIILDKKKVQILFQQGLKQNEISLQMGVSLATLKRFLKENNMKQKNNYLINEN